MSGSLSKISLLLLLTLFVLFGTYSCQDPPATADGIGSYIVFTIKPPAKEDMNHFALRILTKALGTDIAAKSALVYAYTASATGFVARLTPDQVTTLQKQPEVTGIIKDGLVPLDPPSK